ncbi:MAG TPA: hypothetical protein VF209_01335 [Patescibacteria group bacterium]
MLGDDLLPHIKNLNPEELRTFLTLTSAGYRRLIERIRKKHKLGSNEELDSGEYSRDADIKLMIMKQVPKEKRRLYDFAVRVGEKFDDDAFDGWLSKIELSVDIEQALEVVPISEDVLHRSLSGYSLQRIVGAYGLPIYHGSKEVPITEDGWYIKVTPFTHKSTVSESYEAIWKEFKEIAKMADSVGYDPDKRPERSRRTSQKRVSWYLEVEDYIYDFLDSPDLTYQDEDEELRLKDAINAVSQAHNSIFSRVKDAHYDLQNRFSIPKLKQFEKLVISKP